MVVKFPQYMYVSFFNPNFMTNLFLLCKAGKSYEQNTSLLNIGL